MRPKRQSIRIPWTRSRRYTELFALLTPPSNKVKTVHVTARGVCCPQCQAEQPLIDLLRLSLDKI
jgi:hypothetical protein